MFFVLKILDIVNHIVIFLTIIYVVKLMNERIEYIFSEENADHKSEPSLKAHHFISLRGNPPNSHSTFAPVIKRSSTIPENLWESGTLIYSLYHLEQCIQPPKSPSDTILRFNSRFESGNLLLAYHLDHNSYHVILEFDKNKSGCCQWFYFQITNVRKDIKYTFYISGFHKLNGVFNSGSKVFWYSTLNAQNKNISWQRGGSNYEYSVTYSSFPGPYSKNKRSTLAFQMQFPYDNDTCYISYAVPYTYSDLNNNIIKWHRKMPSVFNYSILCQTQCGYDCPHITITSPPPTYPNRASNSMTFTPENDQNKQNHSPRSFRCKSAILLTGRIHPGETNGSIVLHGLIDFLLSSSPYAKYLRDHYVFEIVPMLAIDGVIEGNYRMSAGSSDLNRIWPNPDPIIHPTVFHTKQLFTQISQTRKIEMYVDFHGHSRQHGSFAYGCPNEEPLLKDKEKIFPRLISTLTDAFNYNRCIFSYPRKREGASRIVFRKELDILNSFCIESSFGGITNGSRAGQLNDELIWKELGAACGEAMYHMLVEAPLAREIRAHGNYKPLKKEEKKVHAVPSKSPFSQINLLKMPQPFVKGHSKPYVNPKSQLLRFVSI